MGKLLRIAVAVVAVAALAGAPGGSAAAEEAATAVTAAVTGTNATGLIVQGGVTFGKYLFVAAEDPTGDTSTLPAALGVDITGGTIFSDPAKPRDLVFTMQLASLPAGGIGESIIYGWDLLVNGMPVNNGTGSNIEWRRTNVTGASLANPYVVLRTCVIGATGNNECAGAALSGAMDATTAALTATVRTTQLRADPGALLESNGLSVYHGTGALWFPGIQSDNAFAEPYTIPTRVDSITMGLVAPGFPTPAELPVATTPSGVAATGSFAATVPTAGVAPGDYDLVVRGCWGGNCGETRIPVTV